MVFVVTFQISSSSTSPTSPQMSLLQIKGDFLEILIILPFLTIRRELERLSRQGRRTRGISEPREVLLRFSPIFITLMDDLS